LDRAATRQSDMTEQKEYLIWSEEHGSWWGPGNSGYTRSLFEASRYSLSEAKSIVEKANNFLPATELLHEIAIKDPFKGLPWLRSIEP
jgi:hypothetical protein